MIQSVERALAILVLVADGKGAPVSLKEISERTGLHRSTCAHLLETLAETGFVHQISRNEGFVLGAYAYYLTRYRVFRQELLQVCNPRFAVAAPPDRLHGAAGNSGKPGEVQHQLL